MTLEARISQLEQRLGSSGGKGVPASSPAQQSKAHGRPRTNRVRGYTRPRMTPTETEPAFEKIERNALITTCYRADNRPSLTKILA